MTIRVLFSIILSLIAIAPAVEASQINYDGILIDSKGQPVPDSSYQVRFAIYDGQIGGDFLWQSSGYAIVETSGGKFEYLLGSTNPLSDSLVQFANLWLAISLKDSGETIPRVAFPYIDLHARQTLADIGPNKVESLDPGYISSSEERPTRVPLPDTSVNKPKLRWFVAKAGWDFSGSYGIGSTNSNDVSQGFSLALEMDGSDNPGIGLFGLGAELEAPRSHAHSDNTFGFLSFYAAGKIKLFQFSSESDFMVISAKGGVGLIYGDEYDKKTSSTRAGLYYGAGAGFVLEQALIIEVMYTVNQQGFSFGGGDKSDIQYSRINVALGLILRPDDAR